MGALNRIVKKKNRILSIPERNKVKRLLEDPPAVRKNSIVFTSTEDFSDNPRALYEYMIEHGYNEKYEITWLFEFDRNYRDLDTPNVRSVKMFDRHHQRTAESYEAILSAEYVFFSHNVNWAKVFRPEQTFVELWHGCGYKGRQPGETRVIYFDYCTTTGPKYAKELTTHYLCDEDKLLPLGYPRNDWFRTGKSRAGEFAESIKKQTGAEKLIVWMPTFRKSRVARLSTATTVGETGLPLADTAEELRELDAWCREQGVAVAVKTHVLDADAGDVYIGLTNILHMDNAKLRGEDVNLYEFLAKTDALLTDYSSVAVDYLLLDKPMGFILCDFEEYDRVRGWCYDNVRDYMPGHHIYTKEDLRGFIGDIASGRDGHAADRAAVRPELQTESDSYCRDILDHFGITK